MMVRTSMDVDIHNVSIHGWADNAYRTPSHLPLHVHHALPAPMLVPSCLPKGSHDPQDNIQHLHMREFMAVAAQREENSFCLQVPPREEEAEHAFLDERNHQSKTPDLPCPSRGLCLQSWLLCGRTAERVTHLSPSEGAPILSLTNLHRSVERGQLHQGHQF
jgi:hypothetical protein